MTCRCERGISQCDRVRACRDDVRYAVAADDIAGTWNGDREDGVARAENGSGECAARRTGATTDAI